MASCIERHLPVQEEADWLRLLLFENKVENIAKIMHLTSLSLLLYILRQQILVVHALNTDYLAASNGICTKEARPGLDCCCSKMKSIITHGHVHLSTWQAWLLFIQVFSSNVSYACERIIWRWIWIWTKWQISVLAKIHKLLPFNLILARGPIIIVKRY